MTGDEAWAIGKAGLLIAALQIAYALGAHYG